MPQVEREVEEAEQDARPGRAAPARSPRVRAAVSHTARPGPETSRSAGPRDPEAIAERGIDLDVGMVTAVGYQKAGPTCKSAFFGNAHRILTPHRLLQQHLGDAEDLPQDDKSKFVIGLYGGKRE